MQSGIVCVLFTHFKIQCIQLQAFEQGYKYIRFVLALNIHYAYVSYIFTFVLFRATEHIKRYRNKILNIIFNIFGLFIYLRTLFINHTVKRPAILLYSQVD